MNVNQTKAPVKKRTSLPPALVVARAMTRAELLSGRGVMEYHLPSCVGQKKSISHLTDEGGAASNKQTPVKNEPRSPPRWSLPARRRGRSSSIAGGCFLQTLYCLDGEDA